MIGPATVLVWEPDGLWEARLARELEPAFRVRAARGAGDLSRLSPGPSVLILTAATAGPWLELTDRPRCEGTLLVADGAEDPLWRSAGVSAVFDETTSAGHVAAVVRRVLTPPP